MAANRKTHVLFICSPPDCTQKKAYSFSVPPERFAELRELFRALMPNQRPSVKSARTGPLICSDEWGQFALWLAGKGVTCEQYASVTINCYGDQPDMTDQLKKMNEHPIDLEICRRSYDQWDPV